MSLAPTDPNIHQSINPLRDAVSVISDQEVTQFSDEITVNCAPLV